MKFPVVTGVGAMLLAMDNVRLRSTATAVAPQPRLKLAKMLDGVLVEFTGAPGSVYDIEARTNLFAGAWSQLGRTTADETGVVQFFDANTNLGQRFYRAVSP